MLKAIVNGQIVCSGSILQGQALLFDHQIIGLIPQGELFTVTGITKLIDAHGLLVSPGLIDTHIHGMAGSDTMDGSIDSLQNISRALSEFGVTSFLPTTMTMPWERIEQTLQTVRLAMQQQLPGARVIGAHLEGPFINSEFRGAQDNASLLEPDLDLILPFRDVIRLVTYAPELDQDGLFATGLQKNGICACIGHTGASYEQVIRAISAGVNHATHLFNAMPALHHRQPGPVGAVLDRGITCELIADDHHVHPAIYRLLWKTQGPDRIVLVSDAMRATTKVDGVYDLGGQAVQVYQGVARLSDGRLAGSVLTINQAVLNFQRATAATRQEALQLATANPARLLKLDQRLGSWLPGSAADIALFDGDMNAQLTIVQGEIVYQRK